MLTDQNILDLAVRIVAARLSPEDLVDEIAHSLGMIYTDVLAECENLIEFKLSNFEPETKVIVPDSQQLIGRMPWNIRKKRLEEKFKKISEPAELDKKEAE